MATDDADRRAAEAVASWYAENVWGYDPVQNTKLQAHIAAAIRAAVAAQRERDAASVRGVLAALRDKAGESMRSRDTGDALKALVECDGALLALAAIREGTE